MGITPDTKDWTWVLDRACTECGFDARSFDRANVGDMVRANAHSWAAVLQRADVDHRPSENVWSPLEYACHVRDVYNIYDSRLARMLMEDDPLYQNWDQDETAIADRYNEQIASEVASQLVANATAIADRFDHVRDDQWQRTGRRSDGAHFTIESFARYMIHDPIHHLHDVGALQT